MKISETGQKPDLKKTLKKKSPIPYVLNSNPWLALIPTVGYVLINLDHHVRTQSIIIKRESEYCVLDLESIFGLMRNR